MSKKCCYCGENEAQVEIPDPNEGLPAIWNVCLVCKKIINLQMQFSIAMMFGDKEMAEKIQKEIDTIAYEDGQSVASFTLKRKNSGKYSVKEHIGGMT